MCTVVLQDELTIPTGIESLADFRRWLRSDAFPQEGRIDYIRGSVEVDMSPERLFSHGLVKAAIARRVMDLVEDADLGHVYIDRARLISAPADLSCEPDLCVVTWDSLEAGRVRYLKAPAATDEFDLLEIEGGPDLAVEIVSPSSAGKDTKRLPPAYFAAGVREFWLVDARGDKIRFAIQRRGRRGFLPVGADKHGFQRSEVLGHAFHLLRRPGRVAGTLVYQLESHA